MTEPIDEEIKQDVDTEKDVEQEVEPEMSSYDLLFEGKMEFNIIDKDRQQVVHVSELLRDLFTRVENLEQKEKE